MHGPRRGKVDAVFFLLPLQWSTRICDLLVRFSKAISRNCSTVSINPDGFHCTLCHLKDGMLEQSLSFALAANLMSDAIAMLIPG